MKKEKFSEIVSQLKLKPYKLYSLSDIDSIILENGYGIYPNYEHIKFFLNKKLDTIFIQCGVSKPAGAKLKSTFQVKIGYTDLEFNTPIPVVLEDFWTEPFRNPKAGDILVVHSPETLNILTQTLITDTKQYSNAFYISLISPTNIPQGSLLSFYDPNSISSINNLDRKGIYSLFYPNANSKFENKIEYHSKINIKDIKEINLKLKSRNTYSIY